MGEIRKDIKQVGVGRAAVITGGTYARKHAITDARMHMLWRTYARTLISTQQPCGEC